MDFLSTPCIEEYFPRSILDPALSIYDKQLQLTAHPLKVLWQLFFVRAMIKYKHTGFHKAAEFYQDTLLTLSRLVQDQKITDQELIQELCQYRLIPEMGALARLSKLYLCYTFVLQKEEDAKHILQVFKQCLEEEGTTTFQEILTKVQEKVQTDPLLSPDRPYELLASAGEVGDLKVHKKFFKHQVQFYEFLKNTVNHATGVPNTQKVQKLFNAIQESGGQHEKELSHAVFYVKRVIQDPYDLGLRAEGQSILKQLQQKMLREIKEMIQESSKMEWFLCFDERDQFLEHRKARLNMVYFFLCESAGISCEYGSLDADVVQKQLGLFERHPLREKNTFLERFNQLTNNRALSFLKEFYREQASSFDWVKMYQTKNKNLSKTLLFHCLALNHPSWREEKQVEFEDIFSQNQLHMFVFLPNPSNYTSILFSFFQATTQFLPRNYQQFHLFRIQSTLFESWHNTFFNSSFQTENVLEYADLFDSMQSRIRCLQGLHRLVWFLEENKTHISSFEEEWIDELLQTQIHKLEFQYRKMEDLLEDGMDHLNDLDYDLLYYIQSLKSECLFFPSLYLSLLQTLFELELQIVYRIFERKFSVSGFASLDKLSRWNQLHDFFSTHLFDLLDFLQYVHFKNEGSFVLADSEFFGRLKQVDTFLSSIREKQVAAHSKFLQSQILIQPTSSSQPVVSPSPSSSSDSNSDTDTDTETETPTTSTPDQDQKEQFEKILEANPDSEVHTQRHDDLDHVPFFWNSLLFRFIQPGILWFSSSDSGLLMFCKTTSSICLAEVLPVTTGFVFLRDFLTGPPSLKRLLEPDETPEIYQTKAQLVKGFAERFKLPLEQVRVLDSDKIRQCLHHLLYDQLNPQSKPEELMSFEDAKHHSLQWNSWVSLFLGSSDSFLEKSSAWGGRVQFYRKESPYFTTDFQALQAVLANPSFLTPFLQKFQQAFSQFLDNHTLQLETWKELFFSRLFNISSSRKVRTTSEAQETFQKYTQHLRTFLSPSFSLPYRTYVDAEQCPLDVFFILTKPYTPLVSKYFSKPCEELNFISSMALDGFFSLTSCQPQDKQILHASDVSSSSYACMVFGVGLGSVFLDPQLGKILELQTTDDVWLKLEEFCSSLQTQTQLQFSLPYKFQTPEQETQPQQPQSSQNPQEKTPLTPVCLYGLNEVDVVRRFTQAEELLFYKGFLSPTLDPNIFMINYLGKTPNVFAQQYEITPQDLERCRIHEVSTESSMSVFRLAVCFLPTNECFLLKNAQECFVLFKQKKKHKEDFRVSYEFKKEPVQYSFQGGSSSSSSYLFESLSQLFCYLGLDTLSM